MGDREDRWEGELEVLSGTPQAADDRERVAFNVQRLRKKAGLSQQAVADAMQVAGQTTWHQTTVARVEAGRRTLTFGEWQDLEGIIGHGVMVGTDTERSMTKTGRKARDTILNIHLARAEQALTTALEQADEAMKEIRWLRGAIDKQYREAHPEIEEKYRG